MKNLRLLLSLAVATAVFAVSASADYLTTQENVGVNTVVRDTIRWNASGAVPGTGPLKTDTIIAGTLNDTTVPFDIYGAKQVSVTVFSNSLADDSDFTVYAQVSPNSDTTGAWHTLSVTYSVDNTSGAEVGGTAGTGSDTTLWLLLNNTMPDSMFSAQTGMTAATHGDQAYVRSNSYLRFWIDPDSAALDTTLMQLIVTVVR